MKLLTILISSLLFFSSNMILAKSNAKIGNSMAVSTKPLLKKTKDYCSAIESSVRNIRSIKQLSQELDKYSDKVLLDCLKKLAKDPTLRVKLKRLEAYLESRKNRSGQVKNRKIR